MGAYASRRQIAAEPAQEAAPKRLRTTPSAFAAVIEKEENVTKILEHTGFQAVLALETLNWRVRRAVRGARLEFGVASQASNREIWTAIKALNRVGKRRLAGRGADADGLAVESRRGDAATRTVGGGGCAAATRTVKGGSRWVASWRRRDLDGRRRR